MSFCMKWRTPRWKSLEVNPLHPSKYTNVLKQRSQVAALLGIPPRKYGNYTEYCMKMGYLRFAPPSKNSHVYVKWKFPLGLSVGLAARWWESRTRNNRLFVCNPCFQCQKTQLTVLVTTLIPMWRVALVKTTMESLQHIDHLGVHLKVSKWSESNFYCQQM